jgi:hypothetical protein
MGSPTGPSVAASSRWVDPDGVRLPAGEVHGWTPGTNQTLCGLSLARSALQRFPHVRWSDTFPESGRYADRVSRVCPRCEAAVGGRRTGRRAPWTRTHPRP